jgi:23S rRNA pseudouridine1911/1915/1917 synthase
MNTCNENESVLLQDTLVHTACFAGTDSVQNDRRIANYLAKIFPGSLGTRTRCKKICKKKKFVFVNDSVVTTSAYIVKDGDRIHVDLGGLRSEEDGVHKKEVEIKINVLYEDSHCAVVEKPAGLQTNGVNRLRTLENALSYNLKKSEEASAFPPRPVHRLDLMTGGLVIVAKTRKAAQYFCKQFESRNVRKRYRAILVGNLAQDSGIVNSEIDGKDAVTEYKVVHRTESIHGGCVTTVDLWPKTGRKHQLRKHMAGLGFPIVGDKLYHNLTPGEGQQRKGEVYSDNFFCSGKGMYLRALEIQFKPFLTDDSVVTGKRKSCDGDAALKPISPTIHINIPEPHKFGYYRQNELKRYKKLRETAISSSE